MGTTVMLTPPGGESNLLAFTSCRRFIGRFYLRERILDAVIDTVALARDNGIPIDLLIAGPDFDQLGESFKIRIEALRLDDAVRLHPYIEDDRLMAELQQRTVFITGAVINSAQNGIPEESVSP